jgi:hypothetical protein
LQFADGTFGTVHWHVQVFCVDDTNCVQLAPPFVEYSSFTFEPAFWLVHVIACWLPACHVSPPFGDVTAIEHDPARTSKLAIGLARPVALPTPKAVYVPVSRPDEPIG